MSPWYIVWYCFKKAEGVMVLFSQLCQMSPYQNSCVGAAALTELKQKDGIKKIRTLQGNHLAGSGPRERI